QLNTWVSFQSAEQPLLGQFSVSGNTSDLPEIRRIVRQHDLGLLVPAGNGEALAEALRRMVADVRLRQHHAQRARAAAAALSWEVQEHLLIDLYRRVLS
ncbi:glycosyltransferase, partial [Ectopseudomonas guguanensis]|uniref:glycosyltransferase n=1 Tax=Ectopseudomonas guguanensis TaxID=1198456 RepID=UPI0039C0D77A